MTSDIRQVTLLVLITSIVTHSHQHAFSDMFVGISLTLICHKFTTYLPLDRGLKNQTLILNSIVSSVVNHVWYAKEALKMAWSLQSTTVKMPRRKSFKSAILQKCGERSDVEADSVRVRILGASCDLYAADAPHNFVICHSCQNEM